MNYKSKSFYLEFPIFQILYIIFWIPIGFIVSNIISTIVISVIFHILSKILSVIFPIAFDMFIISGRMQAIIQYYYPIVIIFFDFIFLITGLEIISYFLNKQRFKGDFNEYSSDKQN